MIEARELREGYIIREAAPADVEAACEIAKQAWERIDDSFSKIMGQQMHDDLSPNWKARKADQIRSHFEKNPVWMWVVEHASDGIVAFLTFRIDRDRSLGTIGNNAVDPRAQGTGIGSEMYRVVLDMFRREGLKYAEVQTGLDEGHAPARRAYEKAGFDIRREDVTYYKKL